MKKWIALISAAALAVSLCGCCCCLPLDNKTPAINEPQKQPDASLPVADTLPTEGEPEPRPTEPPRPTEGTPVEPPVEDTRVTAYLLKYMQLVGNYGNGTGYTATSTPEFDADYNLLMITDTSDEADRNVVSVFDRSPKKPLSQQYYHADGTVSYHYEYTYDDRGNTLSILYIDDTTGQTTWSYLYTYDENDNLIHEKSYDGDTFTYELICSYSADGLLEYTIQNFPGYGDSGRTDYTYDEYGNVISEVYSYNGEVASTLNYFNTYSGGKLERSVCYYDGELMSETEYDALGQEVLYIYYLEGKEASRTVTTYDGEKLLESISHYEGELQSHEKCTYDANGNLTEHYRMNQMDGEMRYVYTYGSDNQLTGLRVYTDGVCYRNYSFFYETVLVEEDTAAAIQAVTDYLVNNI